MDIIEPTPSQAAVVLKKFLFADAGINLRLSTAQEAIARTRGYASFQAFVADVPHRGADSQPALTSATGDRLYILSGRKRHDDEDTTYVIWADAEQDAWEQFKLRLCDERGLPEKLAFEEESDYIYITETTYVGRIVDGQFVLENWCQPPKEAPQSRLLPADGMSLEDLEHELREEYQRYSEWDYPDEPEETFEELVKRFADQPKYRLHAMAKRFLELTAVNA